ncbi:MAG TPA: VC0807 family protein [Acidimicrobiales bacterium]
MALTPIHLPGPRAMAHHALPQLLESTIAPAALFYVILSVLDLRGALLATLAWTYLALGRRLLTGRHLPGMLLIASVLLTVRTAAALATGSGFVYFLQPTVGTFLLAAAFLISVPAGKPLAERLAKDFCPLDPSLFKRPYVQRFFLRISLLWTVVFVTNAALGLWFLLTQSLGNFVLLKTSVTTSVIAAAIAVSTLWFRQTLRGEGLALRYRSAGT